MKKALMAVAAMMMMCVGMVGFSASDTYAEGIVKETLDSNCEKNLFGMKPWYAGLVVRVDGKCVVGTPAEGQTAAFVWTVILNILFDAFAVLGIVSTGFIILGGYWFLRSGGDPSFVERGKKTVQAAVVGTIIALVAALVTNLITTIIMSGR